MSEYTKISIHNHFGGKSADCTKDKDSNYQSSFDLMDAYRRIEDAVAHGFRLLGQTNSNEFDASAYVLIRCYAHLRNVEIIPGIEVNLQNWEKPNKVTHIVVLFDPSSNPFLIQQKIRNYYSKNANLESDLKPKSTEKYFLTIDQLSELAICTRTIICIHGKKQEDRSLHDNPEIAKEVLGLSRFLPVATEDNKTYHKLLLNARLKNFLSEEQVDWFESAANISAADRQSFCDIESPTLIWAGNTFDDLFYSVLIGKKRILREEHVVTRLSYIARIVIDSNSSMESSDLLCSHGINSIIGPSGSGKTLLLDLIKRKLKGEPLKDTTSHVAEYDDLCELSSFHLLDANGKEITENSNYRVVELENLYQRIIKAYGSDDTELLEDLGLYIDDSDLSAIVNKFEIALNQYLASRKEEKRLEDEMIKSLSLTTDAQNFIKANSIQRKGTISYTKNSKAARELGEIEETINSLRKDMTKARASFEELKRIARVRGLSESLKRHTKELEAAYDLELENTLKEQQESEKHLLVKVKINEFIYETVQKHNNVISAQAAQVNEKKQVVSDELNKIATNAIKLKLCRLKQSVPHLKKDIIKESLKLKSSMDSAQLTIDSISTELSDIDAIAKAFPGSVGNKPKVKKSAFNPPYDLGDTRDVEKLIDVFFTAGYKGTLNVSLPVDSLAKHSVDIKNEDGVFVPVTEQSAGMLSKAYVAHFLDQAIKGTGSNTIVLYDQPESNMEKAFLHTVLADKFDSLRQTHQLFIATHEPLLVVNADSNEIILATNEKKVGQPNRISYSNRSFVGARGKSKLVEEIAGLIDGGSTAVKQRSDIYEGMKS